MKAAIESLREEMLKAADAQAAQQVPPRERERVQVALHLPRPPSRSLLLLLYYSPT